MNKKKLFCTVIADAILRESQFTRRDLKDIVRIFQYNRVVQDPEDPVFSDDEIKEIKQGLVPSTQNTCLSGVTYYVPNDRISKPWSIADSNNTLERLKELQQPKKQDESWKGDYDFYKPIPEINNPLKYGVSPTFIYTYDTCFGIKSDTKKTYTTTTSNILSGVTYFVPNDRISRPWTSADSNNTLERLKELQQLSWCWPENRKWDC